MTVQFDTLKFEKQLTAEGLPQNQVEGFTEAVRDSFENLATKTDLSILEVKLLNSQSTIKNDLIKWMVGLSFIQVGLCLSMVLSFHSS
jgi:hypothetical protein